MPRVAAFSRNHATATGTPVLFAAAKMSLNARVENSTGRSTAQKINTRARLGKGDRSHRFFQHLLRLSGDAQIKMTGAFSPK